MRLLSIRYVVRAEKHDSRVSLGPAAPEQPERYRCRAQRGNLGRTTKATRQTCMAAAAVTHAWKISW